MQIKPFRSDNRCEPDDERRHGYDHQSTGSQRHAGRGGIVVVKRLQELRHQHGAAEEDKSKKEEEYRSQSEIPVPQQSKIDHRIFVVQFPHDSDH